MLEAVLLGALALTGSPTNAADSPLWVSDETPRAGQPYVALTYTGDGDFSCGGTIGRTPVRTTIESRTEPKTDVCVLHIPADAAGKTLQVGFFVTWQSGNQTTIAHGPSSRPKLIGR